MTDNYKFVDCPACGKKMKKIFLEKQEFIIDVCLDGCGGILLDNRELKKIDEKAEPIKELSDVYKDKSFKIVNNTNNLICPLCNAKMIKNYVSAKREIQIDECYSCGAKFFDYAELDAMRKQYESDSERVQDVLKIVDDSEKMQAIFEELLRKDEADFE